MGETEETPGSCPWVWLSASCLPGVLIWKSSCLVGWRKAQILEHGKFQPSQWVQLRFWLSPSHAYRPVVLHRSGCIIPLHRLPFAETLSCSFPAQQTSNAHSSIAHSSPETVDAPVWLLKYLMTFMCSPVSGHPIISYWNTHGPSWRLDPVQFLFM